MRTNWPRCTCGGAKSFYAIRCMPCEKQRRYEKKRHVCEQCGQTFYQKKDPRPDRPRTNIFCSRRCRGHAQAARAQQRRAEQRRQRSELRALARVVLPPPLRPRPLCADCGMECPRPRRRFCSLACCQRSHARLTRYRNRSGIPEMQIGDELYQARLSLGLASFALQRMGLSMKITGGRSECL